jgi:GNAT superfamily N-acetyltransferase
MTIGVQVREMPDEVSVSLIEDTYREILEPSFGLDELDTLDTLLEGLANGDVWGLCAVDGETPVGCVLGYPFTESKVLLIGYLSIRPGLRSGGIGAKLMDEAQLRWSGTHGLTLTLAEVEDPRRHPVDGDIDPGRRAQFYARRGAQVILGPYFQPRLEGPGRRRVYNLFLTVLDGNDEAITPGNSVRAPQLTDFILEYFRDSGEGDDFPRSDDDEGKKLVAWYRGRATVDLHPIGDYSLIEIPRLGQ